MQYVVEKLAIHLIDKGQFTSAQFSNTEQELTPLQEQVTKFLDAHIYKIWTCDEGNKTRSAKFIEGSQVKKWYDQLMKNADNFLPISKNLAQRLFEVSPGTASPGILMVMLFKLSDQPQKYLGMFKMDPNDEYLMRLASKVIGKFTIDVEKIIQALPQPDSDRVLKCAVIKHPSRADCDLKFRDNQNPSDPAAYFETFLGCQSKPNEKTQVKEVLKSFDNYAEKHDTVQSWSQKTPIFINAIERQQEPISYEMLIKTTREAQIFPDFNESDFKQILSSNIPADDLSISKQYFKLSKMAYHLPSNIVIKGPTEAIKSLVSVIPVADGVEFRIKSTKEYQITYE